MVLIFLTNAIGEETGHGSIVPTEHDLSRIGFEDGPGCIMQYMAEIDGKAYALGTLEICYKGDIFDGDDFWTEDEARENAEDVAARLKSRALEGMIIPPIDDYYDGRFTVELAIPLDSISSRQEADIAFRAAFGSACEADCYIRHGDGKYLDRSRDLVDALRRKEEFESKGLERVYITNHKKEVLDASLVEKYCTPALNAKNHAPKMGM